MKYGTLRKVTYPSGGFTEFDLEANDYYSGSSYNTTLTLVNCNHGYPNGGPCGTFTTVGTPNPVSFNATELPSLTYKLDLKLSPTCNCLNGPPPYQVSMVVKVYNGTTLVAQTGQYQINCNDSIGYSGSGNLQALFNNQLQPNTSYRFEVFVANASAQFKVLKSTTVVVGNVKVGGLRVKQIKMHDGVSTANDIIRNYEYRDSTLSDRSSGFLYQKPKYAYPFTWYKCTNPIPICATGQCGDCIDLPTGGCNVVYYDAGVVPLSSFEGYHIGYQFVKESLPGNGHRSFT